MKEWSLILDKKDLDPIVLVFTFRRIERQEEGCHGLRKLEVPST
jgi:hypothetical protein